MKPSEPQPTNDTSPFNAACCHRLCRCGANQLLVPSTPLDTASRGSSGPFTTPWAGREGRRKGTSGQLGSGARCRRAANSHHLSTPTQHARVRHKGPAREKRRFAFTSCSDSFLGVSYFGCVPCTVRKKTGKRTNDTLGSKRKGGRLRKRLSNVVSTGLFRLRSFTRSLDQGKNGG